MGNILWEIVKRNIPATIAGLVIIVLVCMLLMEKHSVTLLKRAIELCNTQKHALNLSNASLLASLKQQNEAIRLLHQKTASKKNASKKAMDVAKRQSDYYHQKAKVIQEMNLRGNECAQLKALLHQFKKL